MTIIKKEKKGNITVYTVEKIMDDVKADNLKNHFLKRSQIHDIITDDADVYTSEGKLLLKFRKNKLPKKNVEDFYDNVITFANFETSNRGSTSGSEYKNINENPKIKSNIFGYFDRWSPSQKAKFTSLGLSKPFGVRECRFNAEWPEKYKKTIPMIEDIDRLYEKLTPQHYSNQYKKARQIPFKIANTAFTTITTNVNFQTTVHKDKGDDSDGFGNLVVIEKGSYTGGETCFPQYGIGVDVRTNDILFMNVHEWHANLPIKLATKDSVRLSVVCYLRYNIWLRSKGKTKKFMEKHNRTMKKYFEKK